MSSTRRTDRDCHTSSILNFVVGGLVLAGIVVTCVMLLG